MSLSIKQPPSHYQVELLPDLIPDKELGRSGEARTRYGRVVEEILIGLLGLTDIPNSGSHDVVFDAFHLPSKHFCEIKSLRRGSALPIYEWRREKDRKCGVPLVYVIGIHNCAGKDRLADVWRCMAATLDTVLVLPAAVIDELAANYELRHVNPQGSNKEREGHKRAGYCEGYRNIPAKDLLGFAGELPTRVRRSIRTLPCSANIHFHPSIAPWNL